MFKTIFSAVNLGYIIASLIFFLIIISFIFSFIKALFTRKSLKNFINDAVTGFADFPYTFVLLIVGLVCAPLDLYWDVTNYIPEEEFNVAAKLSIVGDPKDYYVDTIISYSKDIEYEDTDGNYGGIKEPGTSVTVNETFYLDECSFSDFEFEDLPEYVNSNQQYDVYVRIPLPDIEYDEEYEEGEEYEYAAATITFPPFTKENLGITDVYSIYPTERKKDHYEVFIFSIIGLALIFRRKIMNKHSGSNTEELNS